MIIFLTGASGVGKTTIVKELEQGSNSGKYECHHFDSVGVPSTKAMTSLEDWQERTTYQWIDKLVSGHGDKMSIIEGSVNISFVLSGFAKHGFDDFMIYLIDCDEVTMFNRLKNRNQPELASEDMKKWRLFLRRQADILSVPIIDTSAIDQKAVAEMLLEKIEHL